MKLKPCPFCGSTKLKIDKKSVLHGFTGSDIRIERHTYSVRCNTCHARGGAVGGKVGPHWVEPSWLPKDVVTSEELKHKAIEAWNRRTPMDDIVEQMEELSRTLSAVDLKSNYGAFLKGKRIGVETVTDMVKGAMDGEE